MMEHHLSSTNHCLTPLGGTQSGKATNQDFHGDKPKQHLFSWPGAWCVMQGHLAAVGVPMSHTHFQSTH